MPWRTRDRAECMVVLAASAIATLWYGTGQLGYTTQFAKEVLRALLVSIGFR